MKFICTLIFMSLLVSVHSQQNMDTIYGNPKSVREKVEFLNEKKQNYKFMQNDGDYGHATIFTPKNIKSRFHLYWYNYHWVFYVNYYKEFTENGLPKNEIWYTKNGSIERSYKYTHNKKGKLITEKELYDDDEFYLTQYSYSYKGDLRSSVSLFSDDSDMYLYKVFQYDSLERLCKISSFDEDGYSHSIYRKYNKFDSIVRVFRHKPRKWVDNRNGSRTYIRDSIGTWKDINRYSYDENKNLVLRTSHKGESNDISGKTIYKYDERNNLIYEGYARDTVYAYRKYKYDLDDRKISYEYSVVKNNSSKELVNYKYDEKGYIIKVLCRFREKEYTIDYKYKFDKKGNWTEITKIVNDEPLYVWTRKIKYY